jgi:hypothetical protein
MTDYRAFFTREGYRLQAAEHYLPQPNPTFRNPAFESAEFRILIVRLSPFRDAARSMPHLFLAQAARRFSPDAYVDLAFFPPHHDRQLFEREGIPLLVGSQSLRSAGEFDVILISNSYVLELINLPYLFLHSDIPLLASQRDGRWPPFILGGSNALATQAIVGSDGDCIADAIFFGEGEGQVETLLQSLWQARTQPKRERLTLAQAQVTGLWVAGAANERVEKAICRTPDREALVTDYPLLNDAEVGTARLQINYGCPAFCSFCFEGYDRKPYRELPLESVLDAARALKRQGCAEIDLYSFNFNTYSDIFPLLLELNRLIDRVSFKSQRVDILYATPGLLSAEISADKRSFTLGVEGISERQRAFLHKSLDLDAIRGVLAALLRDKIREIKLFYILTGHETEEDILEFRSFVSDLKALRRRSNPGVRVIFSVGLLVRMPFTPLRYDRLFLEEEPWRQIIGPVKSACETNGFEFRMPSPWDEVAVSQVLAMGGTWLLEPLLALAQQGHCYDLALPPEYWQALQTWLRVHGHWTPSWLGEKHVDDVFPLDFGISSVSAEFLYRQYQRARAAVDEGYCLGSGEQNGRCLGCSACEDEASRKAILTHRIVMPAPSYWQTLPQIMQKKWRLKPIYVRMRIPDFALWTQSEWRNTWALRTLLATAPELEELLLATSEALFTVREQQMRWGAVAGETIFALKAWDQEALLGQMASVALPEISGIAENFTPGTFQDARLQITLPAAFFPGASSRLRDFLRENYLPVNLRRVGENTHLELSPKALKKRIVFEGCCTSDETASKIQLHVGDRFDLLGFLRSFGHQDLYRKAQVTVSDLQW